MLQEIHGALQRLVYEHSRLDAREIDVRFEAPTREWSQGLTLPTIDFYLFQVRENTDLRSANYTATRTGSGYVKRFPPRRFDLFYMVSVHTSSIVDEHQVLWEVLRTLLKHAEWPEDVLTNGLRNADPPVSGRVAQPDEDIDLMDLWSSMETAPRAALAYVLTAPLDLDITFEGPLVLTRLARYVRTSPDRALYTERVHIGGIVRDKDGNPAPGVKVELEGSAAPAIMTDEEGRYVFPNIPKGTVRLRADTGRGKPVSATFEVPGPGYDIALTSVKE